MNLPAPNNAHPDEGSAREDLRMIAARLNSIACDPRLTDEDLRPLVAALTEMLPHPTLADLDKDQRAQLEGVGVSLGAPFNNDDYKAPRGPYVYAGDAGDGVNATIFCIGDTTTIPVLLPTVTPLIGRARYWAPDGQPVTETPTPQPHVEGGAYSGTQELQAMPPGAVVRDIRGVTFLKKESGWRTLRYGFGSDLDETPTDEHAPYTILFLPTHTTPTSPSTHPEGPNPQG